MYTKVGICEEWVLVRSNPPVRITRVFHARLKSPMIPCCAVWFLMENQCTGWQIISVIICVIFRYRRPPDNKCDLGRFCAGILHYSRFGEADQVVFRCLCVSVRVYWDNHLIHQALHTHTHTCTQSLKWGDLDDVPTVVSRKEKKYLGHMKIE